MNQKTKGIIYIMLAAFCFAGMSVFVRLSGDVPTMQKALFRNAVAAIIAVIMLARSREGFHVQRGSLPFLFLRSAFGCAGLIANFWAVDHLVISDANMLNKLSPFFAIIMSAFILQEIPTLIEWIFVLVAFVGAVFIVHPTAGLASLPALVGLFGGFAAGTAYTFVRKLGNRGERGPVIVCFFSLFSTIVCLPYLLLAYHPMSLQQLLLLVCAGCFAAGGQLSITAAYTCAPAREISVFDYSQVIFAALLGFFCFGEMPDIYSFIGYAIIIVTAIAKWRYNLSYD